MKKTALIMSASALLALSANAQLILTGVIDGPLSGGTPKAIELYVTSDIADLSLYGVELVSNAGSSTGAIETFFSGSATAGQFLYVATEAVEFENVFGFAPNFLTNDVNHNGDDDFYIYGPGNTLLDVWGGSDGLDNTGESYDILDSWAYRLDGTGPSTVFEASEWTIAPVDSLDGLDAAGVASTVPFGTYQVPEPSTYAAIAGVMTLGLAILRRRRK